MKMIKLKTYSINNDCCYRTAYNRFKKGTIRGIQLDNGTILVEDNTTLEENNSINKTNKELNIAIYGRVSSNDRKNQLDEQIKRLYNYSVNNGYNVVKSVKEIASGMNDKRPKLIKLLKDKDIDIIIVENKDRLTRFGFNYIKTLLNINNKDIIVVNDLLIDEKENVDDLMKDFISIITSFCGRIYGKRKSKSKSNKIIECIDNGNC